MQILEDIRRRFAEDAFATTTTGITIDDARKDYARCSMVIDERHFNAGGIVMGGAIFTLADFTFGVAANAGAPDTVTLNGAINYLNVAKGSVLHAEAACLKSGRSTGVYTVTVTDDLGTHVATATFTGFRKG